MAIRNFKTHTPKLGKHSFVDQSAEIIGQVKIGDDCSVWPLTVLRGDMNPIIIGNMTNIQDGSILHTTHAGKLDQQGSIVKIGNGVTIGHKVIVHGSQINDHCLIGMGSCLMDHSLIENDVIIGAGSLVPPGKQIESGYLYLGSPVKKIRPLTQHEKDNIRYSAENYKKLKNHYL